jgi:signal transduction histidine kinase
MVAMVAITLVALNLNSLVVNSLETSISSSEASARQIQLVIMRRIAETQSSGLSIDETKQLWNNTIADDKELAALLEQTMAQSRSIVEINVSGADGTILSSSNPSQVGVPMRARQDLRALHEQAPIARITAILEAGSDYETRVPLGIPNDPRPLFTIQTLVSPTLLRAAMLPSLRNVALVSSFALGIAFVLAYWSANLALRPLARISHLIDDIAGDAQSARPTPPVRIEESRELAIIESKLSVLGERYRGARQDADQLRTNLEDALAQLDAGTRRQVQDQIAIARRLTAINSLTGRVAHEIKNPLNSIALRLELLRSRISGEAPEAESEISVLSEEVTRLDRVVRTFLDFNRPVELAFEDTDAGDLVAEIARFLEPEAAARGVRVELETPVSPLFIRADGGLLRQALLNVAVNGIEAMHNGGSLALRVSRVNDRCVIRIADTGPGIPAEQRERVFQLYYTTKPRGTGIGLAMTFRAVQLHGGTIDIESEPGKGTAFITMLPLNHYPSAAVLPEVSAVG